MRSAIRELVKQYVCAGAIPGRKLMSELLATTACEPSAPEVHFLDFTDIEVATASFLREGIIEYRNVIRNRKSNIYPVIANANSVVKEEVSDILSVKNDAIICCNISNTNEISDFGIIGRLELKQRKIFDLILDRQSIDAGQLQYEFGLTEGVKQTAWNNRLSALSQASLVFEVSDGRSKIYKSILTGA